MNWILLVALGLSLGLGACSHSKKKDEVKAPEAQTETVKKENNKAEKTSEAGLGSVTCETASDKRQIEVVKSGEGCELKYTKFGNEEVIATSASGTSHCEKIADRIKNNLIEAGFKCG
ncbi:MAG: hypothetical protein KDD22_00475 [Bdellovibrionales bacterium]|nr:hypothetical protein [Bdellovibrionales bacterium]